MKDKIIELIDCIDSEELINDIPLFIQLSKIFIDLYDKIDLNIKSTLDGSMISDMSFNESYKLTLDLFKKYDIPLSKYDIEAIHKYNILNIIKSNKEELSYTSLVGCSSVQFRDKTTVNVVDNGKITDAVMLSHELGHLVYSRIFNFNDNFKSEIYAVFTEGLMINELKKMGYTNETKIFTNIRLCDGYNCAKNIYNTLLLLNSYQTFKDISFENMSKLYLGLTKEDYDFILDNTNDLLTQKENESEKEYLSKYNITIKMRYVIGSLIGIYVSRNYISRDNYKKEVKKAFSKRKYNLIDFLNILEVTPSSVEKEIDNIVNELNGKKKSI